MPTYRTDANFLCNLLLCVDVNLVEPNTCELLQIGQFLEDGGYDFAGTTPGRPEIDNNGLVAPDLSRRLYLDFRKAIGEGDVQRT